MNSSTDLVTKIRELEGNIERLETDLELLQAAFDLAEVGFTLSNAEGVVIKINSSQIRITGHAPEMTLGRSMADIELENFNQSATMQVIKTRKPVTIEQTLPSGKSYLVYGQPYFDNEGELKYIICTLIDNTEHNYMRQELETTKNSNRRLKETVHQLQEMVGMQKTLVYSSEEMHRLINICDKVAPFNSTVLICGESGVGKELIAEYIFHHSTRTNKPFIKINCAAIPENLLESELFGYEAGSFTGARTAGKKGLFEIADGGTILMDEIGELPLPLQSKLLRVLQENEFYHIGGIQPINTDVRIIATTNRDLENMIEQGTFRKDLYYRLSVIQIKVPSLSERRKDIPLLIRHFVDKFNKKHGLKKELTFEAIKYLSTLPYEGNVRDLQNVIERVMLLSHNNIINIVDLEEALYSHLNYNESDKPISVNCIDDISLKSLISQYEKDVLQKYWDEFKSASKIAEVLHSSQPTISRKLHLYGILK